MRTIDSIVIHCTATSVDMDIGAEEIRQWHLARGWSDIGYHYVVRRNGIVETGRPIERQGAHVKGFNEFSIGIALVGGVAKDRWTPENNFTRAQIEAAIELCAALVLRYEIPITRVLGHEEVIREITKGSPKACPVLYMADFRQLLRSKLSGGSEIMKQKAAFDRGYREGWNAAIQKAINLQEKELKR